MTYLIGRSEEHLQRLTPCRVVIRRCFGDENLVEKFVFGEFVFYLDAVRSMRKLGDMYINDLKRTGIDGNQIRIRISEETKWEIESGNCWFSGEVEFIK